MYVWKLRAGQYSIRQTVIISQMISVKKPLGSPRQKDFTTNILSIEWFNTAIWDWKIVLYLGPIIPSWTGGPRSLIGSAVRSFCWACFFVSVFVSDFEILASLLQSPPPGTTALGNYFSWSGISLILENKHPWTACSVPLLKHTWLI